MFSPCSGKPNCGCLGSGITSSSESSSPAQLTDGFLVFLACETLREKYLPSRASMINVAPLRPTTSIGSVLNPVESLLFLFCFTNTMSPVEMDDSSFQFDDLHRLSFFLSLSHLALRVFSPWDCPSSSPGV